MFYTYAHITSDTNKIFYIGKGSGRRMYRKDARNNHWHNTVKKHGYKVIKLADWKTSEEAFIHEKLLISSFKGKFHKEEAKEKCRLANLGKIVSNESKQKNKEKHQKPLKINNIIYNSWTEASQKTGIPMGSISYLLKGNKLKKWANHSLELVM